MKITEKKGFTLAELLVVVGIIGVLVAISIPIFASNKTEAELTTCQANRRALRAEMIVEYVADTYSDLGLAFTAIYGAHKDEYVCPNGGDFTWESTGTETGRVVCSYHDGGQSGGGEPEEPSQETIPGTNIPVVGSYWPKQEDYLDPNQIISVNAGGIFQYSDGNYYVVCINTALSKSQAAQGPFGVAYSWFATQKITGREVVFDNDNHQRSDLQRGDVCIVNGRTYVYKDGGSWAYGPTSPLVYGSSWYLIPNS